MANPNVSSTGNQPKDDNILSEDLKRNNEMANTGQDEDLPGYPHYPASEDIMNASKDGRVDIDVENLPKRGSSVNVDLKNGDLPEAGGSSKDEHAAVGDMDDDDIVIVAGTEADVTKDDLAGLEGDSTEPMNRVHLDKLEDDEDDLDIPGSEMDDSNESIGEEDEENNYYSLGGDAHDNLEDDRAGQ